MDGPRQGTVSWSDDKGPSASLAPSAARSTYREYASRAAVGRRLAAGPFSSLYPERFSDRLLEIPPATDHDELAAVAHESRHDPAHDAHAERPQDGRPEAGDVKPLDHQGHEPEADTVQHEQEEAERDQGDRQREDQ